MSSARRTASRSPWSTRNPRASVEITREQSALVVTHLVARTGQWNQSAFRQANHIVQSPQLSKTAAFAKAMPADPYGGTSQPSGRRTTPTTGEAGFEPQILHPDVESFRGMRWPRRLPLLPDDRVSSDIFAEGQGQQCSLTASEYGIRSTITLPRGLSSGEDLNRLADVMRVVSPAATLPATTSAAANACQDAAYGNHCASVPLRRHISMTLNYRYLVLTYVV